MIDDHPSPPAEPLASWNFRIRAGLGICKLTKTLGSTRWAARRGDFTVPVPVAEAKDFRFVSFRFVSSPLLLFSLSSSSSSTSEFVRLMRRWRRVCKACKSNARRAHWQPARRIITASRPCKSPPVCWEVWAQRKCQKRGPRPRPHLQGALSSSAPEARSIRMARGCTIQTNEQKSARSL